MGHLHPVRLIGALLGLALALTVSAAGPMSASADGAAKQPTANAAQGDAGTQALPAGAKACPSTPAKPSASFATCGGSASADSTATISLPGGAVPCTSTATKKSSGAAACSSAVAAGSATNAAGFVVTLGASPSSLAPGGSTTLTATSNQDVGPTPYYIEIFNTTTGAFEAECGYGSSCATIVAESGSTVQNFIAYISGYGTTLPPPNVVATSQTVVVSWLTFSLSVTNATLLPGQSTTIIATSSLDVGPTPYYIEIFDLATGAYPIYCGSGTTCATTVTRSSAVAYYVAYITTFTASPPASYLAVSETFLVTWISLDLTASPAQPRTGDSTLLTATASLDVGPTPFYIEIVDLSLETLVAFCGSGASCSASVSQGPATIHSYIAFVIAHPNVFPSKAWATSYSLEVAWTAPSITVPDLYGQTPDQADATLQAAGLVGGGLDSAVDCNNLGLVDHQIPAAGSLVFPGTAVAITVGVPPADPMSCP